MAAGLSFIVTMAFSYDRRLEMMPLIWTIALGLLSATVVWLCHFKPGVALGAVGVLSVGAPRLCASFEALELVVVYVLYQVTVASALPPALVAATGFTSLMINDSWLRMARHQTFIDPSVLFPAILTVLGVGVGVQGRRVRQQNAELISLRNTDRERAIVEERRRIARDLHDVAAHHLSALVVHNKLARRVGTTVALEEAADFSATTASEALDSLRQVVGVLDRHEGATMTPQPTLADLDAIFTRLGEAGLQVHRDVASFNGRPRRDVELAVVRITQEALTNVLRHRGPGQAWFHLKATSRSIEFSIEDDGPISASNQETTGRTGHGLAGMNERAQACGGQLHVGVSPRGGWRVAATLPSLGTAASPGAW